MKAICYKYTPFGLRKTSNRRTNWFIMEKMRTRRPTMRTQPAEAPKPTYELLKPVTEWSQDDSNRILLVHLPGFKREDVRVQLDSSGKLIISGNRKVTDSKFVSIDQSVDVPKDVTAEKIVGRFENGRLTLTMPIDKQKIDERKAEPTQPETTEGQEKKDEATEQERDEKKAEPMQPKTIDEEEKRDEPTYKEMPKTDEQKKDEPVEKEAEIPKVDEHKGVEPNSNEKKDESIHQEKEEELSKPIDEKNEGSVQNGTANTTREDSVRYETEDATVAKAEDGPKATGSRKRRAIWRDGDLLEKMKRNRKVIAVAVVAFSVGFYVSHQLKSECTMM